MKSGSIVMLIFALLLSSSVGISSVSASPDVRHFSLSSFDVDVDYPSTVKPADGVTITATATSKSSVYVLELMVEILVPSTGGDMRSIYSMSLVKDTSTSYGSTYSKSAVVTVPNEVLRSFMMATVVQNVRTYSYSYSYYPYSYYYPYYRSWYNYSNGRYWWPTYYVTRSYSDIENGLAPLSYILATTPEYTQLKGEYDKLRTNYARLSEENSALTARVSKLQTDYDSLLGQNESLSLSLAFTRVALLVVVVGVAVTSALLLLKKQGKIVIKSPIILKKEKT